MQTQSLVVTFAILTALLLLAAGLTRLSRQPVPTAQFLVGALAAHGTVALGFDTGLRYQTFHDLVFYVFLPILIFAAAYNIQPAALRRVLLPVAGLAVLGVMIASVLIAFMLYFGIGHPSGFPWHAALLTGVLLAATDPAAVTSQSQSAQASAESADAARLELILEGESLFNDASSVVLFTVVLGLALLANGQVTVSTTDTLQSGGLLFLRELAGGTLVGLLVGGLYLLVHRLAQRFAPGHQFPGIIAMWLSLASALLAYHGALALHTSGVVACLLCGLLCARQRLRTATQTETGTKTAREIERYIERDISIERQTETTQAHPADYWQFAADTAGGILFLLMGATITLAMFAERWLAMLIAIAAVFLARFIAVTLVLRTTARHSLGMRDTLTLGSLGMRGAITLALVLILPTELPYWWTVQSIAYGVVLFDLFIIAPAAPEIMARATQRSGA